LFSVSYCRNLNCKNKIPCILVLTCTAGHCARYVYSSLQVSNSVMSHPPSGSSVNSSQIRHGLTLTVQWNMYVNVMLLTDCCKYSQQYCMTGSIWNCWYQWD
jgi:hypothetical protein